MNTNIIKITAIFFFLTACQSSAPPPQGSAPPSANSSSTSSPTASLQASSSLQVGQPASSSSEGIVLTSLKDEPFSLDLENLPVTITKQTWPARDILDPVIYYSKIYLSESNRYCKLRRPSSFYDKMAILYKNSVLIDYAITIKNKNALDGESQYDIELLPNLLHETDLKGMGTDFNNCEANNPLPFAVNSTWMVFTGDCGGIAYNGCNDIQAAVKKTFKLKTGGSPVQSRNPSRSLSGQKSSASSSN